MQKAALLEAGERKTGRFEISCGEVYLQTLTQLEFSRVQQEPEEEHTAWYLALAMVDENGQRFWGDHEIERIQSLRVGLVIEIMEKISEFCLSGISLEEQKKS